MMDDPQIKPEKNLWIPTLLKAFELGELRDHQQLHSGLLQQTWRLETEKGIFIAQKLHPIFTPEVTQDGQIISTYLRSQGFPTPEYLITSTGDLHLLLGSDRWRVMTCLPGITHTTPPDLDHLYQMGTIVGQMHQALANFEYEFQFQIPHFHDTPYLWAKLKDLPMDPAGISAAEFLITTVPDLFLPEDLTRQIIHGDLKLVNFLFDDRGKVTGILDLDTLMIHSLYVEMGDALRSWTKQGDRFDPDALRSSLQGYQTSGALSQLNLDLLLKGFRLITLELGIRFLIDVVEDHYFDWNPNQYPDRRSHNLARCWRQIHLYQESLRQEDPIRSILDSLSTGEYGCATSRIPETTL